MPWKNGGGVTTELWRLPDPESADGFLIRLSIASVATSGPFSLFPGIDRTLLVLDGAGMRLDCADGSAMLLDKPLHPVRFPGETAIESTLLNGPLRDFNLMVRRGEFDAELDVLHPATDLTVLMRQDMRQLYYVVTGKIDTPDRQAVSGDLLVADSASGEICLRAGTTVIAIAIRQVRHLHSV
ncbi:HutD family protein [Burkholderiaceae bacterium DAT-1]|nr:HutD family protein [Burkholderiaceae bacterium DAT-1]